MMPDLLTGALATGSGGIVGLVLGLVGGGGSILAVPLSSMSSAWPRRTWRSAQAPSPSRPARSAISSHTGGWAT